MKRWIVILFLSLATAGCSTGSAERAGSTTQPASAVPVQIPSEGSPSLPNSDSFDTTLSPKGASGALADLFKKLGFQDIQPPGALTFAADYFSARAMEQTALGDLIDVSCRWVRDGETRVLVKSNLPAAQQARLVEMLRSAMATATRPATSKQPQ
jgi:hypothetical protein